MAKSVKEQLTEHLVKELEEFDFDPAGRDEKGRHTPGSAETLERLARAAKVIADLPDPVTEPETPARSESDDELVRRLREGRVH